MTDVLFGLAAFFMNPLKDTAKELTELTKAVLAIIKHFAWLV